MARERNRQPEKVDAPPAFPLNVADWTCPQTGIKVPKTLAENIRSRNALHEWGAQSDENAAKLMDYCSKSILLWTNLFVYTFVVREINEQGQEVAPEIGSDQPFITWPVQDHVMTEMLGAVNGQKDIVVDKSRDMGASWMCVILAAWCWLFKANSTILLTSRVEELVDKRGNQKSLFWKVDYINRNLPLWMLPCPLKELLPGGKFRSHMHLGNPILANAIDGERTTPHIGRGDRRLFVLYDEMAMMADATAAWQSGTDTSSCRIANSTPLGAGTEFSKQRNKGVTSGMPKVLTLGYWDHPTKGRNRQWRCDQDGSQTHVAGRWFWWTPWYQKQVQRRDTMDLAQNVLIDHATAGNRFFNTAIITRHMLNHCVEPQRFEILNGKFEPDDRGRWFVFGHIPENEYFVLAADPSNGKGAANSACAVMATNSRRIVAEFVDAYSGPGELADEMCEAGKTVFKGPNGRSAFLIWEANGPGESMYHDMGVNQYERVYFKRPIGKRMDIRTRDYGWRSGRKEKRVLLARLGRSLVRDELIIPSRAGLNEALEYEIYEDSSIGPGQLREEQTGAREAHGDRVICYGLCLIGAEEEPVWSEPEPAGYAAGTYGDIFGHWKAFHPSSEKRKIWKFVNRN